MSLGDSIFWVIFWDSSVVFFFLELFGGWWMFPNPHPVKRGWKLPPCSMGLAESSMASDDDLPSGELTVCYGKPPFFMGKLTKIRLGHFQLQTVSSPEGSRWFLVVQSTSGGHLWNEKVDLNSLTMKSLKTKKFCQPKSWQNIRLFF